MDFSATRAVIFGVAGTSLSDEERLLFSNAQPFGFILFARNCESPGQIKALVSDLQACVAPRIAAVLIDQEGGRVARLTPPQWRKYPNAKLFADMANDDIEAAAHACYLNARLLAHDLHALGIIVDCAPVADLSVEGAHDIIGDRAFGSDPAQVATLADAMAQGLLDGGVLPVLKHIPGHGRAMVDSHEALPTVNASLDELQQSDFLAFQSLSHVPLGMTAHIVYSALDMERVATLSPVVIDYIRRTIGFDGLLMSDDISMKALKGDLGELSRGIIAAGCDLVLHCNGKIEEMQAIAAATPLMNTEAIRRATAAFDQLPDEVEDEAVSIEAELHRLVPQLAA